MNWEAISAIGEITGALAVVLTFGYFGIQIRATRELAADTNRLHRSNGVREIMLTSIANIEIRQALEKRLGTRPLHEMFSKELGISTDEALAVPSDLIVTESIASDIVSLGCKTTLHSAADKIFSHLIRYYLRKCGATCSEKCY